MKNINSFFFLIFVFILSNSFFSCSYKKIGFFHNTYPHYSVKEKMPDNSSSETAVASSENKISENSNLDFIDVNPRKSQSSSIVKANFEKLNSEKNLPGNSVQKLTKAERKEVKKYFKQNLSKDNNSGIATLLLVIIAVLLPPLAVALVDGLRAPFWLSILLTLLFYVPGLIYALFRIFRAA